MSGRAIASVVMATSAHVSALWRYPVKSMQGEQVTSIELTAEGIVGDRRYALRDPSNGLVMSAKRVPELFAASAVTAPDGTVAITLPDGTTFDAGGSDAAAQLSTWLGRDVELAEVAMGQQSSYDMTLDPPNDAADVYEIPSPPGTFLDLAAVHLLTTSSLQGIATLRPDLNWDVRRFRPNLVVADADEGFPEDDWVDRTVRLGDEAALHGMMRTMRCAMPLRAQPASAGADALAHQVDTFRALSEFHANDLGLYASVSTTGRVRLGDRVELATN